MQQLQDLCDFFTSILMFLKLEHIFCCDPAFFLAFIILATLASSNSKKATIKLL